ncbi:MAG: hypothetical protein KDA86_16425 [Planctomycetaceae bacterium]|nr:hypothetical protein [Planctomycetaceae bacterium]
MLKVNVGLSRKVSQDFNSTGFSVNLEGEVCVPLDDPEGIVEKVKELYDLAEEALNQQVERYESESAIASRDAEPPHRQAPARSQQNSRNGTANPNGSRTSPARNGSRPARNGNSGAPIPATNKQVQYLLNLGKRQGLTTPQLEQRVADILGRNVGLYDLTKEEAGVVLDALTSDRPATTSSRR